MTGGFISIPHIIQDDLVARLFKYLLKPIWLTYMIQYDSLKLLGKKLTTFSSWPDETHSNEQFHVGRSMR